MPSREAATTIGFGLLPLSAKGECWNDAPVQLHEPDGRDASMTEAPQILLQHHLKKLRLPTFQGEYAKQAQICAAENKDHIQYLARCDYVDRRENIIALGPSGTGKTHIHCPAGDCNAICREGPWDLDWPHAREG